MSTLARFAHNPIVRPADIRFAKASGAFNPAAVVCHRTDQVAIFVRVYEEDTGRSCLALALSKDGEHIDSISETPIIGREAPYEEWGVEDARITYLADEQRYAITYTGYSQLGPRVCLITTDDILDPRRYHRHGPRIDGDNKNTVLFPEKIGGKYAFLHRPMPNMVLAFTDTLEQPWPSDGTIVLGPEAGSWRSSRVGAGAPPRRTRLGWLLPFHGATNFDEGNVYGMGWLLLDAADPSRVRWVSRTPALSPQEPYEIVPGPIPQVNMEYFKTGVRVVFAEGMVERGGDLLVYYGAGDVYVGGARVNEEALLAEIEREL